MTEYGVTEAEVRSWKYFHKFVNNKILQYPGYIFRGQKLFSWPLRSSLDRLENNILKKKGAPESRSRIIESFKSAAQSFYSRGFLEDLEEKDLWAIGQHHGLATPLLDWTKSPYVSLFFSFEEESHEEDYRAVFALQAHALKNKNQELVNNGSLAEEDCIGIFSNQDPDNKRALNQSALFTNLPENTDLEEWVKRSYSKNFNGTILLKLKVPNKGRFPCLSSLNRMNINHHSLFPDMNGVCSFINAVNESPGHFDSIGII